MRRLEIEHSVRIVPGAETGTLHELLTILEDQWDDMSDHGGVDQGVEDPDSFAHNEGTFDEVVIKA